MQQTEIILVAFLMKYCKINMNTAIHLIIQKTKNLYLKTIIIFTKKSYNRNKIIHFHLFILPS